MAALAGAERIFETMSQPSEPDDGKIELVNVKEENGKLIPCGEKTNRWAWKKPDGELIPLRGDVRFQHVSFGYDDNRMILKDISLLCYLFSTVDAAFTKGEILTIMQENGLANYFEITDVLSELIERGTLVPSEDGKGYRAAEDARLIARQLDNVLRP